MSGKILSVVLLVISLVLLALSAATLVPSPSAATVSDLGYYTMCPFAPWSTLALLFFGGLSWVLRRHINAQVA